MASNPFAALFSSENTVQETNSDQIVNENIELNNMIEKIFGFTINQNTNATEENQLVFLENCAYTISRHLIDLDILDQCLFERLMLPDPETYILPNNVKSIKQSICRKEVALYLFKCYLFLKTYSQHKAYKAILNILFKNMAVALKQPEFFPEQNIHEQLLHIVWNSDLMYSTEFFERIAEHFHNDEDSDVPFYDAILPFFKCLHAKVAECSLVTLKSRLIDFIIFLSSSDLYAEVFIDYNFQSIDVKMGFTFANTLFGALLSLSILPKTNNGVYEYFDNPLLQANSSLEGNLWSATNILIENLHKIFLNLLKKKPSTKTKVLEWFGKCLESNAARGKIWNIHAPPEMNPSNFTTVGDSLMLNLASVLLKLCMPFSSMPKILKVDPTYCACSEPIVHLKGLTDETCFLPIENSNDDDDSSSTSNTRPAAKSYNFVTECFYLTHRCLDLGFRICSERLLRLNQEMVRIQRAYNDALMHTGGSPSDIVDTIKARMQSEMQKYFSLKTVLLEPHFVSNLMQFNTATSEWLSQVATNLEFNEDTFAPLIPRVINFPLPETVPDTLRCIPEFIAENLVGFLSFLRRFSPRSLEESGYEALAPVLTMVIVFMGSSDRMRNPHMRARLAECLEAMLPRHKDEPDGLNNLGGLQRERLFLEHPHRSQIVRTLLNVFVSIEMTGQSVQFEQKFNYRRPMYIIMDYLWELEEHRNSFLILAKEAEENMEAVTPPIYLRFINLLMNDAVFLLDESLSNMAQIRTMETARANGEWDQLSAPEREQNLAHLQQIGMLARFDNILSKDTTHTLRLLTANTSSVFTHSTMVDRVAAMLNYFLLNLVGPKKKNFKVKDQKEYEFDPANTVLDICHIYVSLGKSDAFCLAVSQDGRSYNPELFSLAENVLARIGGSQLISDLRQVAVRVKEMAKQQKVEEELFADAPDEFLDPIMSTLMTDPVILPSSKKIVDRTTIARHLLSDQTDPFNRSPLTMDQVKPCKEVADKIQQWIEERRRQNTQES